MVQNLRRKSKGVRRRGLKSYENGLQKKVFCLYFRHFLRRFKDCKIYCVLHLYASLVLFFFFKFELRKPHLSLFRPIFSPYRIILNMFRAFWVRLGSLIPILAYLGSFRLIWVHLDSLELIKAHLTPFASCRLF